MADKALLSVRGLHAGYGEVEILRGIDLVVGAGEIVAVLGSNGAGKSTLNLTISGRGCRARRARSEFDGRSIENAKPADDRRAGLIHVPEGRRIFPNMTVRENLDLGSYRRGVGAARYEPQAGVFDLSAAARTRGAARRHAVGRRAADAGDRPRPDGRAEAPDPRRAVARSFAATGRGNVRLILRHQQRRASRSCWSSRTWCRASISFAAPISSRTAAL